MWKSNLESEEAGRKARLQRPQRKFLVGVPRLLDIHHLVHDQGKGQEGRAHKHQGLVCAAVMQRSKH